MRIGRAALWLLCAFAVSVDAYSARRPSPADPVAAALAQSTAKPFADATLAALRAQHSQAPKESTAARKRFVTVHQTSATNDDRIAVLPRIPVLQSVDAEAAEWVQPSAAQSASMPSASGSSARGLLKLDPSTTYQSILGFGGAITEASMVVLATLKPQQVQSVIDAYYSKRGNRYSLGRLHINACDFSVKGDWNFDPVEGDFELKHFDRNLTHEQQYLIPFVRTAIERAHHPLRLFASPWSPPAWLKSNNAMISSGPTGLKPEPEAHQAWARYLSLWVSSMEKQGVPMWGLTVQNEPEYAAPWEACVYSAEEERDFIRDWLGPVLSKEHPNLQLIVYDHNKDHCEHWAQVIFSDPDAAKYTAGLGVHWYSGDEFPNLAAVHQAFPDKFLLATEATNMGSPTPFGKGGSVENAEKYAHDIIGDLNNWVAGWTDWNIALNTQGGPNHLGNCQAHDCNMHCELKCDGCGWLREIDRSRPTLLSSADVRCATGCDAAVIVDTERGELEYTFMYWYLGHFSRFLPPGSRRIAHQMFSSDRDEVRGLEYVAFLVDREQTQHGGKDGEDEESKSAQQSTAETDIVLIVLNSRDSEGSFDIALDNHGAGLRFEAKHGATASITVPPHSIQTIVIDAKWI